MSKQQQKEASKTRKIIAAFCVVVIAVAILVLLLRGDSSAPAKSSGVPPKSQKPSMSLWPAEQTVSKGEDLSVAVWVDPGNDTTNTVEADLKYPVDSFDFVSVDGTGSAFPLAVEGKLQADGEISIVRGTTSPVTKRSLLATVKLKAKDKSGTAAVDFTANSKLLSAKQPKDILSKTTGGKYTVK
jgi:hypothetical protein